MVFSIFAVATALAFSTSSTTFAADKIEVEFDSVGREAFEDLGTASENDSPELESANIDRREQSLGKLRSLERELPPTKQIKFELTVEYLQKFYDEALVYEEIETAGKKKDETQKEFDKRLEAQQAKLFKVLDKICREVATQAKLGQDYIATQSTTDTIQLSFMKKADKKQDPSPDDETLAVLTLKLKIKDKKIVGIAAE